MRSLILHCKSFGYELHTAYGVVAVGTSGDSYNTENATVVFLCIEVQDVAVINKMAKEIRKLSRAHGSSLIVLSPFAHLGGVLAPIEEAQEVLKTLEERLSATIDLQVKVAEFGWHKSYSIDMSGKKGSQTYRSFNAA